MKQITIAVATVLTLLATPALAVGVLPGEMDGGVGNKPRVEDEDKRFVGLPFFPDDKSGSTTPRVQNLKANVEARKASTTERVKDIKMRIEERKASTTARRVEMQQGVAKRLADHTAKVLSATIERLEKIASRIESRIEKLKAEGGVTTEAEGFVAEAKVHLSQARQGVEIFTSIDLSADKAKENFETVRATAATVKEELKAARESLMQAARSLGGDKAGVRATTTVEVN